MNPARKRWRRVRCLLAGCALVCAMLGLGAGSVTAFSDAAPITVVDASSHHISAGGMSDVAACTGCGMPETSELMLLCCLVVVALIGFMVMRQPGARVLRRRAALPCATPACAVPVAWPGPSLLQLAVSRT